MVISLCMIVRDEERHLQDCLATAQPYASEIIIVDTGSIDGTAEIAKLLGGKVHAYPWGDHFAEARNYAAEQAAGEWIFALDADERVEMFDWDEVLPLLVDPMVGGICVTRRNYYSETAGDGFETETICRLYRNIPGIAYRGRVHEDVSESIAEIGLRLAFAEITIGHYGYVKYAVASKAKSDRNIRLLKLALAETPDDPSALYALGTEYFQTEQYEAAIPCYEQVVLPANAGYAADYAYKLSFAYRAVQRRDDAIRLAARGLELYPDSVELVELLAALHIESGQYEETIRLHADGKPSPNVCYFKGIAKERLFDWSEAADFYVQGLALQPQHEAMYSRWLDISFLAEGSITGVVRSLAEKLPEAMDNEMKWGVFFQHAMKWHAGAEALPTLRTMEPSAPSKGKTGADSGGELPGEIAFLRAVFLAQAGRPEQSAELLEELVRLRGMRHDVVYLWAVQNVKIDRLVRLDVLAAGRAIYPELAPLTEVLLGHTIGNAVHPSVSSQAAFALLCVGAWDAFLFLIDRAGGQNKAFIVTNAWFPALLTSPVHVRRRLLDEGVNVLPSDGAFPLRLFRAMLAYSLGRKDESYGILQRLMLDYPYRLEPAIGLVAMLTESVQPLPYTLLADEP